MLQKHGMWTRVSSKRLQFPPARQRPQQHWSWSLSNRPQQNAQHVLRAVQSSNSAELEMQLTSGPWANQQITNTSFPCMQPMYLLRNAAHTTPTHPPCISIFSANKQWSSNLLLADTTLPWTLLTGPETRIQQIAGRFCSNKPSLTLIISGTGGLMKGNSLLSGLNPYQVAQRLLMEKF